MAAASSNQQSNDGTGRHLDQDIAHRMVDDAIQAGATYSEVRLVSNQNTSISMRDGQVRNAISGLDVGATLRCLVNGSWGVHSTTDLQALASQVEATVNLASSVAQRRSKEDSAVELAEIPISTTDVHWRAKKDIRDISMQQKVDVLEEFDSFIRTDERIVSVNTGFTDEHIEMELTTSEGMDRAWSFQRTCTNAIVTGRDYGEVASYRTRVGGVGGFEAVESVDLQQVGSSATESTLRILGAERAPSGKMTLIADPDLTGVYIHEALGHPCEADLVAAGDSCLDGKLGEIIGNPLVTVIDDPTWPGGHGSFPVDAEGFDSKSRTLIENGRLMTFLNHRETAAHFEIEPNGAARAQDGLHHPLVRMSNTMIMGGNHEDLDDLLEGITDGVYACGSRGGQVDTGRGSFQFAAQEAWRIRNGELVEPLKDVSVSGMTLSILKNVDGLTKHAEMASPGFCGKGQVVPVGDGGPEMRIQEALVG